MADGSRPNSGSVPVFQMTPGGRVRPTTTGNIKPGSDRIGDLVDALDSVIAEADALRAKSEALSALGELATEVEGDESDLLPLARQPRDAGAELPDRRQAVEGVSRSDLHILSEELI